VKALFDLVLSSDPHLSGSAFDAALFFPFRSCRGKPAAPGNFWRLCVPACSWLWSSVRSAAPAPRGVIFLDFCPDGPPMTFFCPSIVVLAGPFEAVFRIPGSRLVSSLFRGCFVYVGLFPFLFLVGKLFLRLSLSQLLPVTFSSRWFQPKFTSSAVEAYPFPQIPLSVPSFAQITSCWLCYCASSPSWLPLQETHHPTMSSPGIGMPHFSSTPSSQPSPFS